MEQNVDNVRIKRYDIAVGSDVKHKQIITGRADKAGDLFGKYIVLHDHLGANRVFYFDDILTVVEADYLVPELPSTGWTAIRVPIAEGASATAAIAALKTKVDGVTGVFTSTQSGKTLTVLNTVAGFTIPGRDAIVPAGKTGFSFRVVDQGFARQPIGALDGDIGISGMETTIKEITTHATGETPQGEITTGYANLELTFNMLEMDDASFQRVMVYIGGQILRPEIEDAPDVVGYGPTLMGGSKPKFLVTLHPSEADLSDTTGDIKFWKTALSTDGITFSPTEFMTLPIKATVYPDTTKPVSIQYFAKGDTAWLAAI